MGFNCTSIQVIHTFPSREDEFDYQTKALHTKLKNKCFYSKYLSEFGTLLKNGNMPTQFHFNVHSFIASRVQCTAPQFTLNSGLQIISQLVAVKLSSQTSPILVWTIPIFGWTNIN